MLNLRINTDKKDKNIISFSTMNRREENPVFFIVIPDLNGEHLDWILKTVAFLLTQLAGRCGFSQSFF